MMETYKYLMISKMVCETIRKTDEQGVYETVKSAHGKNTGRNCVR